MSQDDYERVTLRLPKSLARKVKQEAKKNRLSANSYLVAAADFATKNLVFFAAAPEAATEPPKALKAIKGGKHA